MEYIVIPNLSAIRGASKLCIDCPATLCEMMRTGLCNDDSSNAIKILTDVIAKLNRHQIDDNHDTSLDNLYELVKEFSTTTLLDLESKQHGLYNRPPPSPGFLRFVTKSRIPTEETFDIDTTNTLTTEIKVLEKTAKKHQELISALQRAGDKYAKIQSEVEKYKFMLSVAESSRHEFDKKISDRESKVRTKTITNLQKKMKVKVEMEDRASLTYTLLASQVHSVQRELIKMSLDLNLKLTLDLLDRADSSMSKLRLLAGTFLPKDSSFLKRLAELDVLDIVHAIVKKNEKIHTILDIRKLTSLHGVNIQLSDGPSGVQANCG